MKSSHFFVSLVLVLATLSGAVPSSQAAVDVTPTELQNAAALLRPDGSSLSTLSGFSSFYYRAQSTISGGIATTYQTLLLSDPWLRSGLPELQLLALAYPDQDAATAAFDSHLSSSRFNAEDLVLVSESSHAFFYTRADEGSGVDLFGSVSTDSLSFHWLEKNGNVLIQASLYLGEGSIHEDTRNRFSSLIGDEVSAVLSDAAEAEKISLGLLFPPEDPFFSAKTESSALNLDDALSIPKNGTLNLDIYVSDPASAEGTVLDSSGLLSASDGDLYLYINKEGKLLAGLYAPSFDANCVQSAGWYSLSSSTALYPYEWNRVTLRFGVGGFGLKLNEGVESYCSVSQARSSRPLYMGDYPLDSVSEGMIGIVDHVSRVFSLDSLGRTVDTVLANQLFLDLEALDPDLELFRLLKEKKVFLGSDGFLRPDSPLNRAAMVKVLLRTFGYATSSASVSFSDVSGEVWYRKYLAKAVEIGMVEGREDGTFGGADPVTRAEFFTMLMRMDSGFELDEVPPAFLDLEEDAWYEGGARYAEAKGFVEGDYFSPTQMVTRRDAAQVLYTFLN